MDDIDTMTIGDAKAAVARAKEIEAKIGFQAANPITNCAPIARDTYNHGLQIVILDRGFVFVGDVSEDGGWLLIKNAKNIRRWGTSRGLGELAARGPLADTKLDDSGTVRAPMRAVIGLLQCEVASWTK